MPYGWEGQRTGHTSQTSVVLHLRAGGLEEGDDSDEHPPTRGVRVEHFSYPTRTRT